jgi:hypothetical protein
MMSAHISQEKQEFEKVVGVFGIRRFQDAQRGVFYSNAPFVERELKTLLPGWEEGRIKIISGGGNGVELIAEEWAIKNSVPFQRIKPIHLDPPLDPFDVRNEMIIRECTEILVFWDAVDANVSRAIRESVRQQRKLTIIPIDCDIRR